jgi:hypothetical protein
MKELIEVLTLIIVILKFYVDLNEKFDDLKLMLVIQQAKINQIIDASDLDVSKLDLKDLKDS